MHLGLIGEHAAGAVHRLNGEVLAVDDGGVHVVLVVVPVAARLPQVAAQNHRRGNLHIAVALVDFAPVVDERILEHHALGKEEREAGALVQDGEQAQFLAELAVVAFFGLLEHREVGVKIGLFFKRRAIDALEHLVLFAAAPVGARHAHEFGVFEFSGGGDVRPGAQVDELALPVKADDRVLRQVADELHLVWLAQLFHIGNGLFPRQLKPLEREVLPGNLFHFLFDGRQVVRGKRLRRVKVVVKAVFNGRADGQLDLWVETLDRLREHVRSGVAVRPAAVFVGKGEEADRVVALDGAECVAVYAVDGARERSFGQARADGCGDLQAGHAVLKLAL